MVPILEDLLSLLTISYDRCEVGDNIALIMFFKYIKEDNMPDAVLWSAKVDSQDAYIVATFYILKYSSNPHFTSFISNKITRTRLSSVEISRAGVWLLGKKDVLPDVYDKDYKFLSSFRPM